jgi:Spy/CpxP family protein refolding chaperone
MYHFLKTNNMKKILLTMVALLSMTAVMAQDGDKKERKAPKEFNAEEMTNRMADDLELTAEQKAKVLDLNKEFVKDQKEQMKERKEQMKERKERMEKRKEFGEKRKAYNEKLKSILTPEQYKKFQEKHKHGHHGRPGHHGGPRGPRGPRPADIPED